MNSEVNNDDVDSIDDDLEDEDTESLDDTVVMSDTGDSDGDGDTTVERIIADFERTDHQTAARKMAIRRRLEELAEEKSFEDTFAFDDDDD